MKIVNDESNHSQITELLRREDLKLGLDYENGNLAMSLFYCKQDGTAELLASKVCKIPIDNY